MLKFAFGFNLKVQLLFFWQRRLFVWKVTGASIFSLAVDGGMGCCLVQWMASESGHPVYDGGVLGMPPNERSRFPDSTFICGVPFSSRQI